MTFAELIDRYRAADSVPPYPALLGLDRPDWAAVRAAHGPATGVPALLRALVADEPDHRGRALEALCETIWHQGDVYPATTLAVPFLYNLLTADGPHDREAIAYLLAIIAEGRPPFASCEDDPDAAATWQAILSRDGRSLDDEMAEGRRQIAALREAMEARLPTLAPFLASPIPDVRLAVAGAIGRFPDAAARLLPALEAAVREEADASVRVTLVGTIVRAIRGAGVDAPDR